MRDLRPVHHCLCFEHTFGDLKRLAEEQGLTTVTQTTERTGCGSGCGLCVPYLELMLQTGETAFAVLSAIPEQEQKP